MKKPFILIISILLLCALSATLTVGCSDQKEPVDKTPESYKITTEKTDVFKDYYTVSTDKSLTTSGKTVTVTVDAWDFLKVDKVFANDAACTEGEDGKFTFTMPEEDVTVRVEFEINIIPEGENGLKWTDYDQLTTEADLSRSIEVDFGSEPILNSVYANPEGYSTMYYAKVYSTNHDVIPNDAIRRIEPIVGNNGAYAIGAWISFDITKVNAGKTVLVFIDTDNDRIITAELNVVK